MSLHVRGRAAHESLLMRMLFSLVSKSAAVRGNLWVLSDFYSSKKQLLDELCRPIRRIQSRLDI